MEKWDKALYLLVVFLVSAALIALAKRYYKAGVLLLVMVVDILDRLEWDHEKYRR